MTASTTPRVRGRGSVRGAVRACGAALVAAIAILAPLADPSPAHAASRVDVGPTPSADGPTTVTLSGSGFQYLPNAPGGVYVFFGAVSDPFSNAWAPSQGGRSGETFSYSSVGGSQLLVAFSGGSSADAANAAIDANGNWSAQLTIPGSSFQATSGDPHSGGATTGATIDCLQVQCGIITIGAHGNVNANNESFTPISFVTADGSVRSGTGAQSFTDDATAIELPGGNNTDAQPAEQGTKQNNAPAADATQVTSETSPAEGGFNTTWLVLGVLGFAVLALIGALIAVLVRRGKGKRPVKAPSANDDETDAEEEPK